MCVCVCVCVSGLLGNPPSRSAPEYISYEYITIRKEMFYLTTHSTHFIYGYMASEHNNKGRERASKNMCVCV